MSTATGVVVIGRNEGERLVRCLRSLIERAAIVVYVDSGSTDGSVALAKELGAHVVELDMSIPFTAARARNTGRERLAELQPQIRYVQFVDGDCELDSKWLVRALAFLEEHGDVAVVCGRRRERHPDASIYNAMCDIEWDTPVGEALYCGGDALMRMSALQGVGGYRADMIAGEEPELCVRLRAAGWRIWRLDAEMTLHDAAMMRFGQWWSRAKRAGHAYAHGAYLHGAPPMRHWVRELRSACLWGGGLPLLVLGVSVGAPEAGLLLLVVYPLQWIRLLVTAQPPTRANRHRAGFLILAKFAEFLGVMHFWRHQLAGRRSRLIEYK